MSKIMVKFEAPGMTAKQYDQIWQDLRDAGQSNPKGLLHHAGAPTDKGWMVIDVWESAELFDEFGKILMPIIAKNGVTMAGPPVVLPIHYEYSVR